MKKRIFTTLLVLGLVSGTCLTCSAEENAIKPEKLVILMSSEGTAPMEKAINIFTEETGIEVELISEAYDNMHNKIVTMVAGGSRLDIISLDTVWPAEFANSDLLIPLDEYLEEGYGDQFVDIAWDQLQYEGKQYGIPTGNDAKWLFYNKAILEEAGYSEPPKTWEELSAMSLDMIDKGLIKYGMTMGASQTEGLTCDFTALLYGFGGQYRENDLQADGEWKLDSDEAIATVTWMKDSLENGVLDPASITYTDRNAMNSFMTGDVAFVTGWSSYWTATNSEEESAVAGNVGMTVLPGSENVVSGSVAGGGGFGVAASSESPEYAVEFLKLLCREEVQKEFLSGVSQMPTLNALYADEALLAEFPILEMAYPQYEYAHCRPILVQYQEWSKALQGAIHEIIAGGEDPSETMTTLQTQITETIKQ